ncbi:MAG: MATE family efflux transporter [Spirochaetaceae bacterium]|nr:MATE family efflux transporter [Spirochaetaceae bacterium]
MDNENKSEGVLPTNPLGQEKIGKLLLKFAIPSILSNMINAIHNIVDQVFIGQGVGIVGNAATNIAFPLTTIATAIALLLGVGSSSNFNLNLGAGNREKAARIAATGISMMFIFGILLCVLVRIFLEPLLHIFGSPEEVFSYSLTYTGITSFALPLMIVSTGLSVLIRSDGSPKYAMMCISVGAIIHTILDPIFIFVFDMGIAGAAIATNIGHFVACFLAVRYLFKFKSVILKKEYFFPKLNLFKAIASLGAASCFNQLAMTLTQIVMNNTLRHYGALSRYGSDIPIAVVGVILKVNILFMAFVLGIAHACQPIVGFNYGAKNYERVKKTYIRAIISVTVIAVITFACFQLFPRQIVGIFGKGNEMYFHFAERYFRIYMLFIFMNGVQPLTANFFTSIGKATRGVFISMTRQIIFLQPLILIFPIFMGIDGVMYAGPIADGAAATLAIIFIIHEFKRMGARKEVNK